MRNCPVCLSSMRDPVWKQNFLDLRTEGEVTQTVYRCGCGMVYSESPDVDYVNESLYACPAVYGDDPWQTRHYIQIAHRIFDHCNRNGELLDIGCATGGLLNQLKRTGFYRIEGIDLTPKAVEIAKLRGFKAECMTVDQVQKTYDVVTLSHVLEHVPEPRPLLRKIKRILKSDSILYIEVPDRTRYEILPGVYQVFNLEHINHFSLRELSEIAWKCGYEVMKCGRADPLHPWGYYPAIYCMIRPFEDHLDETIVTMQAKREKMESSVNGHDRLAVWGTGQVTLALFGSDSWKHIKVETATDTNTVFHGRQMLGVTVVPPDQFKPDPEVPILIGSQLKQEEILARIKELGLPNRCLTLPTSMI